MSDTDNDKPKLGMRAPLGLRRTVETGKVKQSFSHGRSKTVQVEVVKKRVVAPGQRPSAAAGAPAAAPADPLLEVRNLRVEFPTRRGTLVALHDVSFSIAPGEIPTEGMSKRIKPGDEAGARTKAMNPMGRVGTMEELQNLAVFLISGGCDWINGETIAMDGAQALAMGGNFYQLRDWSDDDWTKARE